LLAAFAQLAAPEQLPLKVFTTADGLARDGINRIFRDSRGFLWFATHEGLSRFDGYQFTNYTADQGLPQGSVNDILETRNGEFWIATREGVVHFNPLGVAQSHLTVADPQDSLGSTVPNYSKAMFVTYYPAADKGSRMINALVEDRDGSIWCGTLKGVYKLKPLGGRWTMQTVDLAAAVKSGDNALVETLAEDQEGVLWIGTDLGLYRRYPDGTVEEYSFSNVKNVFINTLLIDSDGNVWVGTRYNGLYNLSMDRDGNRVRAEESFGVKDGLGSGWIASIFESSEKVLWVGTNTGLSKEIGTEQFHGRKFISYTTAQGLSDPEVWSIAEDESGSLWLGSANGGAMKLVQNGFTTYDRRDGLAQAHVTSIFADRTGAVCVTTAVNAGRSINRFDGERFVSAWPESISPGGWGWNQIVFQDHTGDWWFDSGSGVYRAADVDRFEELSKARIKAKYTTTQGLGADEIFRLFEDSHGDVWIGGISHGPAGLTRWERNTGTLHAYGPAAGINDAPTAFREDAAGNLWVGFYGGMLARYIHGSFEYFSEHEGKPAGMIRALYLDAQHRLWIASSRGGVSRVDNPADDNPKFVTYTTKDGLSSNDIWAITEDRWGRIYLGTGRALDQFDPDTGHVKHYTSADGLARGKVEEAFRDRRGNLWFGTAEGLSRFVPQPDKIQNAPPILITGLRVAGTVRRISAMGETLLSNLVLDPQQKDLQIEFVGLDFAPGEIIHYQYKLEGAGQDWSAPSTQRSVSYANLSPGNYRFLVRAVSAGGVISATPAAVTFRILPPIWQRWWFIALGMLAVSLIAYRVHRYRLGQALQLERVRTRIATDLHDDIGSSLSQVSVLSEVIQRRIKHDAAVAEPLTTIANVSRNLVDSMNDIVWAINPRRDHLSDLGQRMRRFASDVFTARDIDFEFRAPQSQQDIPLGADMRRDVFMIFKEGINNIVRHSQCTRAAIEFAIADRRLRLTIADNGAGFNPAAASEGNGMFTMRQRAKQIGGTLDVQSSSTGTTLMLEVPVNRRHWGWTRFRRGATNGNGHNGNGNSRR